MNILIILFIVWAVAIGGIFIMRKIQPGIIYPIWAVSVAILFTLFLLTHVF